jgi:hypothetical protein
MKLFTGVFVILTIHQVISSNFLTKVVSNLDREDKQWDMVAETIESIIRNSFPKQDGFYEIVVVSMTSRYKVSRLLKSLMDKDDVVINAIVNFDSTEPVNLLEGKSPDFAIIVQDKFDHVRFII